MGSCEELVLEMVPTKCCIIVTNATAIAIRDVCIGLNYIMCVKVDEVWCYVILSIVLAFVHLNLDSIMLHIKILTKISILNFCD